jgi:hypothetical protein
MPRRFAVLLLAATIFIHTSARGQTSIVLSSLQVQLWPEYDQPSMLVINDFQLAAGTQLPAGVLIKFPREANLVAVAVHGADGSLLNADYLESVGDEEWRSVVVQVQSPAAYRIEYYQPLARSGDRREFSYEWDSEYAVQDFRISVRVPADAITISSDPALLTAQAAGGYPILENDFGSLEAGGQFALQLHYTRSSETLQEGLQPSQPVSSSTPGRVMLSNYVPYLLGALGLVLITGGSLYFWQSSRGGESGEKPRHGGSQSAAPRAGDSYCNQCGTRAQPGDRFCRVCGTRLRPQQ